MNIKCILSFRTNPITEEIPLPSEKDTKAEIQFVNSEIARCIEENEAIKLMFSDGQPMEIGLHRVFTNNERAIKGLNLRRIELTNGLALVR